MRRLALLAALVALAACGTAGGDPLDVQAMLDRAPATSAATSVDGAQPGDGPADAGAAGSSGSPTTGGRETTRAGAALPKGQQPAVTPTRGSVEVGVRYVTGADQLVNLLGASGFSVPDTKAMAQALVDQINAEGGLAGKQIVPVWHAYDASDPAGTATQEQTACAAFAEDHHVPVVISPIFSSEVLQGCLADRGVVLIDENYGFFDMAVAPATYFVPGYPDPVRSATVLVDSLVTSGFFGKAPKVGMTMKDTPDRHRVAAAIKAALKRHGLAVADEIRYTTDHPEALESGILRFRASGISHVFVLDIGGLETGLVMQAAEAQGYRPTYAIDTRNNPNYVQLNSPVEQLQGAAGVGWVPSADVGRGAGSEPGANEQRCAKLMRDAGIELRDAGNDRLAFATCDVFWLLQTGAARGGDVSSGALRTGIESLGDFTPTGSFASRLAPARHDGTTAGRRFAFDGGCACFRYTSQLLDMR